MDQPRKLEARSAAGAPSSAPPLMRRRELWAATILLVLASFLYRLPSLANAEGTNADAAVVGLQAMHILRGEHAAFLWGSGYQTAADSYVAALFFAVLGPSGLALRLSTLLEHIVLTLAVFGILARRFRPAVAALLAAVLVFTPDTLHTYILYPPRQLSLTLCFVGLWLADSVTAPAAAATSDESTAGLPQPRRAWKGLLRVAAGAALGTLACAADPYALIFLPLWGVWIVALVFDAWRGEAGAEKGWAVRGRRLGAAAAGAAVGAIPFLLLLIHPKHTEGTLSLNWADVPRRWQLLIDECLPALVSTRVYAYAPDGSWGVYPFPPIFQALQRAFGWLFLAAVASGFGLALVRRIPLSVRRLGVAGAAALPLTVAAFLSSSMVMDRHSSRYLAALLLFAPFALAPLAHVLSGARAAIVLLPYLCSAAVGGWTSFRPFCDGLRIDRTWGRQADAWALFRALEERHIRYGIADYWSSYRLTFLWREAIIVVPKAVSTDRYAPQREAFSKAEVVAYIHDRERSDESADDVAAAVAAGKTPFEPRFERLTAGSFTALVLTRREPAPNLW